MVSTYLAEKVFEFIFNKTLDGIAEPYLEGQEDIFDKISLTRIELIHKNNFLDCLTQGSFAEFYSDFELVNCTFLPMRIKIDGFICKGRGPINSAFTTLYRGQYFQIDDIGQPIVVLPNSSLKFSLAQYFKESVQTETFFDNSAVHFLDSHKPLAYIEYDGVVKYPNSDGKNVLDKNIFNILVPNNGPNPNKGIMISMKISIQINNFTINRFIYGAYTTKSNEVKLNEFIKAAKSKDSSTQRALIYTDSFMVSPVCQFNGSNQYCKNGLFVRNHPIDLYRRDKAEYEKIDFKITSTHLLRMNKSSVEDYEESILYISKFREIPNGALPFM